MAGSGPSAGGRREGTAGAGTDDGRVVPVTRAVLGLGGSGAPQCAQILRGPWSRRPQDGQIMEATFEPTTLTVPRPPDGGDGRLGDVPILPLSQLPSEGTLPRNGMRRPCEGTCRVARGLARPSTPTPFFEGLSGSLGHRRRSRTLRASGFEGVGRERIGSAPALLHEHLVGSAAEDRSTPAAVDYRDPPEPGLGSVVPEDVGLWVQLVFASRTRRRRGLRDGHDESEGRAWRKDYPSPHRGAWYPIKSGRSHPARRCPRSEGPAGLARALLARNGPEPMPCQLESNAPGGAPSRAVKVGAFQVRIRDRPRRSAGVGRSTPPEVSLGLGLPRDLSTLRSSQGRVVS